MRRQARHIFPDHWVLFGGAREAGEALAAALRRELLEELNYDAGVAHLFTRMEFGFEILGANRAAREHYEVRMPSTAVACPDLREGRALQALTATEILLEKRVVPYNSVAIWMHQAWIRRDTGPCRQS